MIETNLILLEGPPGSGKTTTAQKLADEISNSGKICNCFLEWSSDHPIQIGGDEHLGQVIATSIVREEDVLQQWQGFVRRRRTDNLITVMESRFWQTNLMLMYAAGCPIENLLESHQRQIEVIQEMKPVLIYFAIDNLTELVPRTIQIKDEEWRRSGHSGSWAQHISDAFDAQRWFTDRGLTGVTAMIAFLEEWTSITETLYDRLPFPKIKIRNPHINWDVAMRQIQSFLGLPGMAGGGEN